MAYRPHERTIAYLDVANKPASRESESSYNFYHLAPLLTAVARKCPKIEITLRLTNRDVDPIIGLPYIIVPRVCKAIVSAHPKDYTIEGGDYWTFFLGAHVFPDLCSLETKGFPHLPEEKPLALERQMTLACRAMQQRLNALDMRSQVMFKRLEFLRSLRIEGDVTLNPPRLRSLLGSTQMAMHLTTLEIVQCPRGFFEADIATVGSLLRRSLTELPELRKLKFHTADYMNLVAQRPYIHLCDVVRKFGQRIEHLDLAFPCACASIFAPQYATASSARDPQRTLGPPNIAREPLDTLPKRLIDQGFKYRRLIRYIQMCSAWTGDEPDDWNLMTASAGEQGAEYSWEIIDVETNVASWYVGEHDAVHFSADDVVKQPY